MMNLNDRLERIEELGYFINGIGFIVGIVCLGVDIIFGTDWAPYYIICYFICGIGFIILIPIMADFFFLYMLLISWWLEPLASFLYKLPLKLWNNIKQTSNTKDTRVNLNDVAQATSPFTFEQAMREIDVTRTKVLIPFWIMVWGFIATIAFLCFGMIPSAIFCGICMIFGALRLFFVINTYKKIKIKSLLGTDWGQDKP